MYLRQDPGPCPICGAEHTACTGHPGPIVVVQLPARDAAAVVLAPLAPTAPPAATVAAPAPLRAQAVQATLGPNEFTSATYRKKRGR
jgi:hypothetical protein